MTDPHNAQHLWRSNISQGGPHYPTFQPSNHGEQFGEKNRAHNLLVKFLCSSYLFCDCSLFSYVKNLILQMLISCLLCVGSELDESKTKEVISCKVWLKNSEVCQGEGYREYLQANGIRRRVSHFFH